MVNNPFAEDGVIECKWCHSGEWLENEDGARNNFCGQCGHKIDWPEVNLTDWNNPIVNLPKKCSSVMAKYNGKEVKVWYSMKGNWMPKDVFTYLRTTDAWRYLKEDNDEESNT